MWDGGRGKKMNRIDEEERVKDMCAKEERGKKKSKG